MGLDSRFAKQPVGQITAALRAGERYEFAMALIAIHRLS